MKIKYLRDCECSPIDGASISLPLRLREYVRRKIEKKCEGKRMGKMSGKCCPLDIALLCTYKPTVAVVMCIGSKQLKFLIWKKERYQGSTPVTGPNSS